MHQLSKIASILCLTLGTTGALANNSPSTNNALQDISNSAQVSVDENTGLARFIRFDNAQKSNKRTSRSRFVASSSDESIAFLRTYGSAFGITDVDKELKFVGGNRDKLGTEHNIFEQTYKGLPVFGGELRTHFNADGHMVAVNGNFLASLKVPTTPLLREGNAAVLAFEQVLSDPTKAITPETLESAGDKEQRHGTPAELSVANSTLMVFRAGLLKGTPGLDHLVYEVEVVNAAGNMREFVYVDAINGDVVDQISGIHEVLNRRAYDAEGQPHPGPNYTNNPFWVEGDPLPTGNLEADNMIYASEETYSFFANAFGRDSWDGVGGVMDAIFNRGDSCPNASWNGTYISFCPGLTTDDVTAHEWGHAYTGATNGLIYQWQSGALNESFSDIWGETVDRINGRDATDQPEGPRTDGSCSIYQTGSGDDSVRWLLGEDSTAPGLTGALRDMWNPNCAGDPARVRDEIYHCLESDNGGVHINSGVPNRAFSMMVDGATFNGYTVEGIGLTKAAHIHWATQNMLTPSSNFADHADALEASCSVLTGVDLLGLEDGLPSGEVINAADCQQVADIIEAVQFRIPPDCDFDAILQADAPALCEGLGDVQTFFSEDFENGGLPAGWTVSSHDVANPATFDSEGWTVTGEVPYGADGVFAAFAPDLIAGDCGVDTEAGVVNLDSPVIELPSVAVPHVAFTHWVATEAGWDGGNLKVSVNGGPFVLVPSEAYSFNPYNGVLNAGDNPLAGEPAFTGTDQGGFTGSWGQSQVDLYGIALPGDQVQLRFDLGTDGCNGAKGWYIDSVEAYSCSAEQPPVCGDGEVNIGEMCDDGNTANGDGCSSSCQVESGFVCASPTEGRDSTNVVADWSFEGGFPNADWTPASSFTGLPGFPLCGPGCPAESLANGSWLVWIGGVAGVSSSIEQDLVIPASATELTVNTWRGLCDAPTDFIQVTIDGTEIGRVTCDGTDTGYVEQIMPLAGFNDGQMHTLVIGGTVGGTNGTHSNFFVDDVAIEDNTPVPGAPSVCAAVVTDMACNAEPVGFDLGIASSWTVIDNTGGGVIWTNTANAPLSNATGGTGDAASVNSDANIFVEFDTELHSNSFSLENFTGATLEFKVNYRNYLNNDFLNLGISIDGGETWENLLSWNESHEGETVTVDLTHYAGEADVKLRWHYVDPNTGDWDWYAQVDDVALVCDNETEALRCDVNLDGFVDKNDIRAINAASGQSAASGDPRDDDGDGTITRTDSRNCSRVCTLPRCATQ